ncbi:SixA phosphatase family protein [Mangrovimonas spongiae]|uniref:Histidine phosphatase family protein n=1 Tax=Mangrovimonas spongiae TaxID=2494697 RepID=A0A3R9NVF9_9FLAO|nr:histidine phosphatase family protein [Mangrovimonas spongiae]RSK38524.1 histidine phosphatase family protein [Mangrovimonas spongiae]
MKNLIIVRHGKSSWKYDVDDFYRPLKQRGENDAQIIAQELEKRGYSPDLVLSSDAVRAKTTAKIFSSVLNFDFKLNHSLYDFSGRQVLEVVHSCDNSIGTLMVFGHNYGLTSIINTLGNKYIDNLPTSGLVVMSFETDNWKSIQNGHTVLTLFPKNFR